MIIEISVAIIALALVALVITVAILAKNFQQTLMQVNRTLVEVRKQLDDLGGQTSKIMDHTNHVSYDLKRKLESLDPIFNAFSNVGDYLAHKTFALKKDPVNSSHHEGKHSTVESSEFIEEQISQEPIKAGDILELVDIGIRLWQKIKKRR